MFASQKPQGMVNRIQFEELDDDNGKSEFRTEKKEKTLYD